MLIWIAMPTLEDIERAVTVSNRRHGVAVAAQQLFHRPDTTFVAASRAINLGVLERYVSAAGAFAFAAALAFPERDELRTASPGIGAEFSWASLCAMPLTKPGLGE